ncbi:PAC2 family protein [Arthrobacter pigmenti]
MLDPLTLFSTNAEVMDSEGLTGLNMLMGFTGYADAGQVTTQIGEELLDRLDHELVATFDADQLIDYRSRRPHITFIEDHFADYQPPRLELYRLYDSLRQPFLLLTGFEPDFQWERFASAVIALVRRLDVNLVTWVHSMPMPVPHTRPLGVTAHGNQPDLIEGITAWKPTAELSASVGHLLELRLAEADIKVVGYVVHVPHYLAEATYPQAAAGALEYLGAAAGLMLPADRLREEGHSVERQIADQVAGSTEVQNVVANLEKKYDEYAQGVERRSLLTKSNDELPGADELGAAVEAYLATQESTQEPADFSPGSGGADGDSSGEPPDHGDAGNSYDNAEGQDGGRAGGEGDDGGIQGGRSGL